jgi:hypothetical protein
MYYIKIKRVVICLFVLTTLVGCHVMLIGAYDSVVDQDIQKIQTDVLSLLIKVDQNILNNDSTSNKYENFKNTYASIESETENTYIRCQALPKYQKVNEQVELLNQNVAILESFHRNGFRDTLSVNLIKRTFEVEFIAIIKLQEGLKTQKTN